MKKILLIISLLCIFLCVYTQDYYYYVNGEKKYLELDLERVFVSSIGEEPVEKIVKKRSSLTSPIVKKDNLSSILKTKQKVSKDFYWSEVRLNKMDNKEAYDNEIENLKQDQGVNLISPYFKGDKGQKIGLSNYFYVKLKSIKDTTILQAFAEKHNVIIVKNNKYMPLWITLSCTQNTEGNALDMSNLFYESQQFDSAEPDLMTDLTMSQTDPFFSNQWGLKNIGLYNGTPNIDVNMVNAWQYSKGLGVNVAVIDHGIELDHPDLISNIHPLSCNTYSPNSGGSQVEGDHGTACAGIIGAMENKLGIVGVAPKCKLMSISNRLRTETNSRETLADGINWAWQNGADILSNSWGSNYLAGNFITDAINNAIINGRNGKGCVVVFASGNDNSSITYPATLSNVIAVGAMSPCGQRKSPSSCDGENWGSNYGDNISVVAPGVLIPTTDRQGSSGYNPFQKIHTGNGGNKISKDFDDTNYTTWFNGTSAACPHVAGVAALILSIDPNLTSQQVKNIIESTAQKLGGYNYNISKTNGMWNNEMGYGLVNAYEACKKAANNMSILTISGSQYICSSSSESYSISNLPSGSSVSWGANTNLSAPYPQLIVNSPSQNQCTVKNQYSYPLEFLLEATVSLADGKKVYPYKPLVSEESRLTTFIGTYTQVSSPTVNVVNRAFNTPAMHIQPSIEAAIKFTNVGSRPFSLATFSGNSIPTYWYYNKSNTTLYVMLPSAGGSAYTFSVEDESSCASSLFTLFASTGAPKTNSIDVGTVNIYDVFSGSKVYTEKAVETNTFDLKNTNLPKGYYIIEVVSETGERTTDKVSLSY